MKSYLLVKRILDLLLAIILLIATLPIMIIAAVTIKIESEGPVLFVQKRPGNDKNLANY